MWSESCPRGRATLVPAINERVHVARELPRKGVPWGAALEHLINEREGRCC